MARAGCACLVERRAGICAPTTAVFSLAFRITRARVSCGWSFRSNLSTGLQNRVGAPECVRRLLPHDGLAARTLWWTGGPPLASRPGWSWSCEARSGAWHSSHAEHCLGVERFHVKHLPSPACRALLPARERTLAGCGAKFMQIVGGAGVLGQTATSKLRAPCACPERAGAPSVWRSPPLLLSEHSWVGGRAGRRGLGASWGLSMWVVAPAWLFVSAPFAEIRRFACRLYAPGAEPGVVRLVDRCGH